MFPFKDRKTGLKTSRPGALHLAQTGVNNAWSAAAAIHWRGYLQRPGKARATLNGEVAWIPLQPDNRDPAIVLGTGATVLGALALSGGGPDSTCVALSARGCGDVFTLVPADPGERPGRSSLHVLGQWARASARFRLDDPRPGLWVLWKLLRRKIHALGWRTRPRELS